jgi:hypothetical protein
MIDTKKVETYNIKVVAKDNDILDRFPKLLPEVTNITSHEVLLDMIHSFRHMADKADGNLCITRTIHLWCSRCGAYIGKRDVDYITKKFTYNREIHPSDTEDYEVESHECQACGEISIFHFKPVLHLMY